MAQPRLPDLARRALPQLGSTEGIPAPRTKEYWTEVFGRLWGSVDIRPCGDRPLSGRLHSRKIGQLTFSRLEFGNQHFVRHRADLDRLDEPFYSLSFPYAGQALFEVDGRAIPLMPQRIFLLNNSRTCGLAVARRYATFNIKIPTRALEQRLGRKTDILKRSIVSPEAIYWMMHRMICDLLTNGHALDDQAARFMTNQMLDTVAFFLGSSGSESDDRIARRSHRARVLAFIDARFADDRLSPAAIAAECGISRSYLYSLFADGEPVMERLRRRRLEAARSRIAASPTKLSMTQLAMDCGFSSSSEFSRLFKIAFGVPPSRYEP